MFGDDGLHAATCAAPSDTAKESKPDHADAALLILHEVPPTTSLNTTLLPKGARIAERTANLQSQNRNCQHAMQHARVNPRVALRALAVTMRNRIALHAARIRHIHANAGNPRCGNGAPRRVRGCRSGCVRFRSPVRNGHCSMRRAERRYGAHGTCAFGHPRLQARVSGGGTQEASDERTPHAMSSARFASRRAGGRGDRLRMRSRCRFTRADDAAGSSRRSPTGSAGSWPGGSGSTAGLPQGARR